MAIRVDARAGNPAVWIAAFALVAVFLGTATVATADVIRDFQVSTGNDDAEESVATGNVNLTSSDLELIQDGGDQIVGIRFQNINIPQGAAILRAWIEFETDETSSGATSLTIRGEDVDDAPGFTTANSDISSRITTTASTAWAPPAWNTVSERHETPDLSGIVQEIVNRSGWSSGNDMVFIITGSGRRVAESFNGESANAPILRIEVQGSASTPGGALCWAVDDGANHLRIVDTSDGTEDTDVGDTGAGSIEALAIDPNGLTIYAANAGQLGRINPDTGEFIRLRLPFGTGGGARGNITFSDVDSLSFDSSGTLWGVHAGAGDDVLFQIDPQSGAHVPDAFGPGVDYVSVSGTGVGASIDDIAFDPATGILYGADTNNSQLVTIDTTTGAATVVGSYGGTPDMEGLAFHFDGTLYGTALQQMFTLNTSTGAATQIGTGNTLGPGSDFEAFDCNFTALTRAVLARFTARREGTSVLVEWETSSEEGTAGFYLYRFDAGEKRWLVLNERLLPALQSAPQGGRYRFLDVRAPAKGDAAGWFYGLLEVEAEGRMTAHGPFFRNPDGPEASETTTLVENGPGFESLSAFSRFARRSARQVQREDRRRRVARNIAASPRRARKRSLPALKVLVSERGIYRLDAERIATELGVEFPAAWVRERIANAQVSLERRGESVSWYATPESNGVVFYSDGHDDLYGSDDILRLSFHRGALMRERASPEPRRGTPGDAFRDRLLREEDVFAGIAVGPDPESDYWFWSVLNAGDAAWNRKRFTLRVDSPASSGAPATLLVEVYGATTSGLPKEHRLEVRLNGQHLGSAEFGGLGSHRHSFDFPQYLLRPGENEVELEAVLGSAPYSILYVDGFELEYQRRYEAAADRIWFHGGETRSLRVGGFSTPDLVVLDVTDTNRPERLAVTVRAAGAYGFDFLPRPGARYVAATAHRIPHAGLRPWALSEKPLRSRLFADYVAIAHESLRAGAEALAEYRKSDGLETLVVTVEEIQNEFSYGYPTPHALRDFLRHAHDRWLRAPRYVVLVGEGSWDYRNLLGQNDSLVPPIMTLGVKGIYASDNTLADVSEDDGLPEMAVGRIPVTSTAELAAYLDKLRAFESNGRDERLLLLSDLEHRGGRFQSDSRTLAPDGVPADEISLNELPVAAARKRLRAALREGRGVVTYAGHGGLDRFAISGLVTSSDVTELGNFDRLPVLVSLSCSTNRFSITGFDSLGEQLVQEESGGAVAVWGPSALTGHAQSLLLVQPFLSSVYSGAPRLGDAVLEALRSYASKADSERLLRVFTLLGDPALRIN